MKSARQGLRTLSALFRLSGVLLVSTLLVACQFAGSNDRPDEIPGDASQLGETGDGDQSELQEVLRLSCLPVVGSNIPSPNYFAVDLYQAGVEMTPGGLLSWHSRGSMGFGYEGIPFGECMELVDPSSSVSTKISLPDSISGVSTADFVVEGVAGSPTHDVVHVVGRHIPNGEYLPKSVLQDFESRSNHFIFDVASQTWVISELSVPDNQSGDVFQSHIELATQNAAGVVLELSQWQSAQPKFSQEDNALVRFESEGGKQTVTHRIEIPVSIGPMELHLDPLASRAVVLIWPSDQVMDGVRYLQVDFDTGSVREGEIRNPEGLISQVSLSSDLQTAFFSGKSFAWFQAQEALSNELGPFGWNQRNPNGSVEDLLAYLRVNYEEFLERSAEIEADLGTDRVFAFDLSAGSELWSVDQRLVGDAFLSTLPRVFTAGAPEKLWAMTPPEAFGPESLGALPQASELVAESRTLNLLTEDGITSSNTPLCELGFGVEDGPVGGSAEAGGPNSIFQHVPTLLVKLAGSSEVYVGCAVFELTPSGDLPGSYDEKVVVSYYLALRILEVGN